MSRKAIDNTHNYSKNQAYPLENRLAALIVTTSTDGIYQEKHTEAAEFLGVSYDHLLYVLAGFVKENILKKSKGGYLITDPQALAALAEKVKRSD